VVWASHLISLCAAARPCWMTTQSTAACGDCCFDTVRVTEQAASVCLSICRCLCMCYLCAVPVNLHCVSPCVPLAVRVRKKLSLFCQVSPSHVIAVKDVTNTYRVPLLLASQDLPQLLFATLRITPPRTSPDLVAWSALAEAADEPFPVVNIALVGKYCKLQDAYLSVLKALNHACLAAKRKLVVTWISGEALEEKHKVDAIDTLHGRMYLCITVFMCVLMCVFMCVFMCVRVYVCVPVNSRGRWRMLRATLMPGQRCDRVTACWCRVALGTGASRARSPPSHTHDNTKCRSWAFAWACSAR
jgi:hypothetical protein